MRRIHCGFWGLKKRRFLIYMDFWVFPVTVKGTLMNLHPSTNGEAEPKPGNSGLIKRLASVRLTLFILIVLAILSAIGTLLPQDGPAAEAADRFGLPLFRIFSALGFFNIYQSVLFRFVLIVFAVNLVVCSLDRIKPTWRIVFPKTPPAIRPGRFKRASASTVLEVPLPPPAAENIAQAIPGFSAKGLRREPLPDDSGLLLFRERYRWTRLGPYVVHASIILLLAGALFGSVAGFKGYVNVPEGEAVDHVRVNRSPSMIPLGFAIRCDEFEVEFYETKEKRSNPMPKEYRSQLTLLVDGKPVHQKVIRVNDPLLFKGIRIYQSSYGKTPDSAVIGIRSTESKLVYQKQMKIGDTITVPENGGEFRLQGFRENLRFMGEMNVGNTFFGRLQPPEGQTQDVLLPTRFPKFDNMRKGDFQFYVKSFDYKEYTGLQINRDPGVPLVYTGFVILIIGIFITYFLAHDRILVEIVEKPAGSRIVVAGLTNKYPTRMENQIRRIADHLLDKAGGEETEKSG